MKPTEAERRVLASYCKRMADESGAAWDPHRVSAIGIPNLTDPERVAREFLAGLETGK